MHAVAPVPETARAGQAVQGGVPVLLKEFLAQRPLLSQARTVNTTDGVRAGVDIDRRILLR